VNILGLGGGAGVGATAAFNGWMIPAWLLPAFLQPTTANPVHLMLGIAGGPATAGAIAGLGFGVLVGRTSRNQYAKGRAREMNAVLKKLPLLIDFLSPETLESVDIEPPKRAQVKSRRWFDFATMEWISYSNRGFLYVGTFLE